MGSVRGEAVVLSHEPGHEPAVHVSLGFTMDRSRQRHRQIVRDLASVIGSCLLTARRLALTLSTRQLAPDDKGLVVSFRQVQADEELLSLREGFKLST